ncbi:MAG: hypothetical protein ACYSWO_20025 [Planctomycetota bacterium]|jgi:hypothetical protein
MKRILIPFLLVTAGAATTVADTHALIVTGINKDARDRQAKDKAVADLRDFLLDSASVKRADLAVLANSRTMVRKQSDKSTAANLKDRTDKFAAAVKPADRFMFYYVGQANVAGGKLRLNLPGPDVTGEQLAKWLSRIKASSMLIVLDCPGAGLAVEALAGEGRIVVAGSTAEQNYSTRFSEYFVPALGDNRSDTDGDGKVSLLEAFTSASRQLDDFYRSNGLLQTETPLLDDNGDGEPGKRPWRFEQNKTDGAAASKFFLSCKRSGAGVP